MQFARPAAAYRLLRSDPVMAGLIAAAGRYRQQPLPDWAPFEALARAIAHQQLHRAAAESILRRFCALFGDGGFPQPHQVLACEPAQLRSAGFSLAKIAALRDLAGKALSGAVPDRATLLRLPDEQIIERLSSVRGIGRWTVEMMLMFHLGRPDVLPVDDFGIRNGFRLAYRLRGMPRARALLQFGERWKPYRSLAAWYLWRANELARQQRLPRAARPPRIALQVQRKPAAKSTRRSQRAARGTRRTR